MARSDPVLDLDAFSFSRFIPPPPINRRHLLLRRLHPAIRALVIEVKDYALTVYNMQKCDEGSVTGNYAS